jgi:hypothetical protein
MFCDFQAQDVLLDLGPGWGGSFQTAREIFEKPALAAIELNSGADLMYERLYGAKCYATTRDFLESSGRLAKIAILSHSLEHYAVRDIPTLLNDLHEVVSIDGALVIEVPHDDFRSRKATLAFQTPHLCFFSPESLQMALVQAGWNVEFIKTCSHLITPDGIGRPSPKVEIRGSSSWRTRLRKNIPDSMVPTFRVARSLKNELMRACGVRNLAQLNLVYGSGRDCLRAVATHSKSRTSRINAPI